MLKHKKKTSDNKIKPMGKWNYIIIYGMLVWGLVIGTLFLTLVIRKYDWYLVLMNYMFFLVCGFVFGLITWHNFQERMNYS